MRLSDTTACKLSLMREHFFRMRVGDYALCGAAETVVFASN
jgi:hypothetical protein